MGFRDTTGGGRNVSTRLMVIWQGFETPHVVFLWFSTISGDSDIYTHACVHISICHGSENLVLVSSV